MKADSYIPDLPERLPGIHALRGVAALMVLLFHVHHVGLIPLPQSWGLIASHGGFGVELFFVLSAFSLLYSSRKYTQQSDQKWLLTYLSKRFFRIAPLFYTMLFIHCMLILFVFNGALDIKRVVMSLLFIFNFAPKEAEGIVWASWSIGVEMIFYAFLPMAMVLIRSLRGAALLWCVGVLVSYFYRQLLESDPSIPNGYAHYAFMSQMGVFCCGILGYWIFSKIQKTYGVTRQYFWWVTVVLGPILAIVLLTEVGVFLVSAGRPDTQLWGLSFGLTAALVAISTKRWMSHPILQHLGERSYSIYLIHAVVIYGTGSTIRDLYEVLYPTLGGYGFAVCASVVFCVTLLIAEVSYRFIEVPGIALGRRILTSRFSAIYEEKKPETPLSSRS